MKQQFKNHLLQFFPISEEQWKALEKLLTEKSIAAGRHLIQPGQTADKMYYILQGGLRSYLLRDGEDITDYFFFEQSFATDFAAYYGQKPAVFYLEALQDCELIQINKEDFLDLARRYPLFETMGRIMAEMAFVEIEERMRLLHHENLESRFRWMMQKFPQVFQRVPQYQIASYLGVKPESLSRIKKSIGTKQ